LSKALVIVESPAKANTIGKYLGSDYLVRSSKGHVRDLPAGAFGVDVAHGFRPTYRLIPDRAKVVEGLRKDAKRVDTIFLAADPDREGEAICHHLASVLATEEGIPVFRVLFNEITKPAILAAFEHPGQIDQHKFEAQQARRILDRIVGYKVSPLLWKKVKKGLSAGRVQTVAVRLIVEREREIKAFDPQEYWEFKARLANADGPEFEAKAFRLDGKKFSIDNREDAERLYAELKEAQFKVTSIDKKERKRNPLPPFITSKLQQEAVRKLGFTVKKTMTIAQKLYEGVEIGAEGTQGLITYMRTDSTRISDSALEESRQYIERSFGGEYLPAKPARYRTKKDAQDAHEAIRPTSVERSPDSMKKFLSRDELRLYTLIWNRFVASQMLPARFDQTEIVVEAGRAEFKAVGSIMRFDGFLKIYRSDEDEDAGENAEGTRLPDCRVDQQLEVKAILHEQKFTQPPPRYNEASLVKALEEKGIGRPSTYQQILSVILQRNYVVKQENRFEPTEIGCVVNDLLVGHFNEIFDFDYTARLEQDLDNIESGAEAWVETLSRFYTGFKARLDEAESGMRNVRREQQLIDEKCERCGHQLAIKLGRYGSYIGCTNFPKCRFTRPLEKSNGDAAGKPSEPLNETCPDCGANLVRRTGRFGQFVSCGNYPKCRYVKRETTGVRCPKCGQGDLVARRSRRGRGGKTFYGCQRYPACDFVVWQKPVPTPCPKCGAPFLVVRQDRNKDTFHTCANKECGYSIQVEASPEGTPEAAPALD